LTESFWAFIGGILHAEAGLAIATGV